MGFEPTIPAFERAKTVHALDRVATVIGIRHCVASNYGMTDTHRLDRTAIVFPSKCTLHIYIFFFFFFYYNEIYNLLSILRVFSKFVDSIDFVGVAGQYRFTLYS
jgi:hypothetical protein